MANSKNGGIMGWLQGCKSLLNINVLLIIALNVLNSYGNNVNNTIKALAGVQVIGLAPSVIGTAASVFTIVAFLFRSSYSNTIDKLRDKEQEVLAEIPVDSLAVMMIYNDNPADAYRPLRDEDFVRAKVPMTKQEVRWLVRDLLAVRPEDVVYDIGAGTGSCTMELARCANLGAVYAVECKPEAVQLIRENREKTKNFHVSVIEATAPDGLNELPPPDCVFIGGSRGNLAEIVAACVEKNPKVRMVITAIALETLAQAQQAMAEFCEVSITCVNISRAKTVGNYHMMTANNPVWVIGGRHE